MTYGISFDFWNTLYGNGNENKRAKLRINFFRKTISSHHKFKKNSIEVAFKASREFFFYEWQNNYRTPTPKERILYMAKLLSLDLTRQEIDTISDYFGGLIFTIPPRTLPSVKFIIRELSERYPLGIISDTGYISGEFIRKFLDKEGLLSCFKSMVFSDEQTYCKPHSSVFELTMKNLQVDSTGMIHIGDLEKTDIIGANKSGWTSVKFIGASRESDTTSEADYTIDHFNLFPRLLDSIDKS